MDIRVLALGIILTILGLPLMFLNMAESVPYQALEVYTEKQPYTTYKIEEKVQTKTIAQPYIDKETTTRTEYKVTPYYKYGYSWWWGYPYWYDYYYEPYYGGCCYPYYYYYYPYTGCCHYYYNYPYPAVSYKTEPYTVTDTNLVVKYKEVQTQEKVLETKSVTEYMDITKIREVTRYREKPVMWPQFLGIAFVISGIVTVMGGFFLGYRK